MGPIILKILRKESHNYITDTFNILNDVFVTQFCVYMNHYPPTLRTGPTVRLEKDATLTSPFGVEGVSVSHDHSLSCLGKTRANRVRVNP